MFTGVVDRMGVARSLKRVRGTTILEVETGRGPGGSGFTKELKAGGSVCVSGACLTVIQKKGPRLFFNLVNETQKRTTFGRLKNTDVVNLERPLRAGGRLEGHFVLGHVDGVGRVARVDNRGAERSFLIRYPRSLGRYLAEKGSVTVNGVSLTLGKVNSAGFWVHCIPHTLRQTNLGQLKVSDRVNLEADYLAKLAHQS